MDRGAWRATVNGGAKESDTTERLSRHVVVINNNNKLIIIQIFLFCKTSYTDSVMKKPQYGKKVRPILDEKQCDK